MTLAGTGLVASLGRVVARGARCEEDRGAVARKQLPRELSATTLRAASTMSPHKVAPRSSAAWSLLAYTIGDDKGGFGAVDRMTEVDVSSICRAADLARLRVAFQLDFKRHPGVYRATLTPRPQPVARARRTRRGAKRRGPHGSFHDVDPRGRYFWREVTDKLEQSDLRLEEDRTHLDAASSDVLRRFLHFGRRACPAQRYILHFSGHAFGPMGLFYDSRTGAPNPHVLRLTHLARAMRFKGGPFEVVLFRDCFLDNLEAAFELHGAARFMIATQAEAPILGTWPWLNLLSVLTPSVESRDAARSLGLQMEDYFSQKSGLGPFHEVPCALIDVEGAQQVARPLKRLVAELSRARTDAARRQSCADALERARVGQDLRSNHPGDPALIDVLTMCRNLQALGDDPVAPLAQALGDVIHTRVITSFHVVRGPYRGLGLYYKPTSQRDLQLSFIQAGDARDTLSDERYYRTLALSRATGWDQIGLNPLTV